MSKIRKITLFGKEYAVRVNTREHYSNGRTVIRLVGAHESDWGEPILTASVNLPDLDCPKGEAWIKDYSENEGVKDWLIAEGLIEAESEAVHRLYFNTLVTRHKLILAAERKTAPIDPRFPQAHYGNDLKAPKVTGPMDSCSSHEKE